MQGWAVRWDDSRKQAEFTRGGGGRAGGVSVVLDLDAPVEVANRRRELGLSVFDEMERLERRVKRLQDVPNAAEALKRAARERFSD